MCFILFKKVESKYQKPFIERETVPYSAVFFIFPAFHEDISNFNAAWLCLTWPTEDEVQIKVCTESQFDGKNSVLRIGDRSTKAWGFCLIPVAIALKEISSSTQTIPSRSS